MVKLNLFKTFWIELMILRRLMKPRMVMIDKIKSKLLTKLFVDWVNDEFDVECLKQVK